MKNNKWYFLKILPVISFASLISCSSADAFDINCIFNYKVDEQKCSDFISELKNKSNIELNNELCFDLFRHVSAKQIGKNFIKDDDTLYKLYLDNNLRIIDRINACSLQFKDNELIANFLGYISFIFVNEYKLSDSITYYENDYLMWTYDLINIKVDVDPNKCSFIYKDNVDSKNHNCIGFITQKINNGNNEHIYPIYDVDTSLEYQTIDNKSIPYNINHYVLE